MLCFVEKSGRLKLKAITVLVSDGIMRRSVNESGIVLVAYWL